MFPISRKACEESFSSFHHQGYGCPPLFHPLLTQ